ncbi:MAG: DUF4160 domain-containing protein [Oscillospiraceae bacterium]|nr:DUF4160 domain-containing protein [Oscillospiraceae bacterium]
MPEVSRFLGVVVKIFFRGEHNPPHIHVVYGEYNGLFEIATMEMIEGDLSPRIQRLVKEWGEQYKDDLQRMWDTKQLKKLPPLE